MQRGDGKREKSDSKNAAHALIIVGPIPNRILNDRRFAKLPMLLETPKVDTPRTRRESDVDPLDRMNLATLRKLIDQSPKTSAAKR